MFLSQGINIVENKRIEILISKYGDVFKKILSKDEINDIDKIISIKKFKKFLGDLQLRKPQLKRLVLVWEWV